MRLPGLALQVENDRLPVVRILNLVYVGNSVIAGNNFSTGRNAGDRARY